MLHPEALKFLTLFILITSSVEWEIIGVDLFVQAFRECSITLQAFGPDIEFSYLQISIPLTLFRTLSLQHTPGLNTTKLHPKLSCIITILVLHPADEFYLTLQSNQNNLNWKLGFDAPRLRPFGATTYPLQYTFILTHHMHFISPLLNILHMYHIATFAWHFAIDHTKQLLWLDFTFFHLCPGCIPLFTSQSGDKKIAGVKNFKTKTQVPNQLRKELRELLRDAESRIILRHAYAEELHTNHTYLKQPLVCSNPKVLPQLLCSYECAISSSDQIYESMIISTLFRSYNYTDVGYRRTGLFALFENPYLRYETLSVLARKTAQHKSIRRKMTLVSYTFYNFISCHSSVRSLSFLFYLHPFQWEIWVLYLLSLLILAATFVHTHKYIHKNCKDSTIETITALISPILDQSPSFPKLFPAINVLALAWCLCVIILSSSYKGLVVVQLTSPRVMTNSITGFWNLENFTLYTPYHGISQRNGCFAHREFKEAVFATKSKFSSRLSNEFNEYRTASKSNASYEYLLDLSTRITLCTLGMYNSILNFRNHTRYSCVKKAFVENGNGQAMEMSRRLLNTGLRGEPYKIWKKPWLQDKMIWTFATTTGTRAQKKLSQLIESGIDKFWRDMELFLKELPFSIFAPEASDIYVLSLNGGQIVTPFYMLIAGIIGAGMLLILEQFVLSLQIFMYVFHNY